MKSVLDSRQLLAARVLANTGSFTLAGQQLCLTQSAVSHAIKALEDDVECRLFHRSGKGVTVTPAGKHFLNHIDLILGQMETARGLVAPRSARGKDRLRLGMSSRARDMILPAVQPRFQKEFPGGLMLTRPGDYQRNIELLAAGLVDLAFTIQMEPHPELEFSPLFEDELRFIVASSHPWARSGRACSADLEQDTLLVYQDHNNTGVLLSRHFKSERIVARHGLELADHGAIKALVRTGQVAGVLSPWLVSKELLDGSLVSLTIGSRPLIRQWGLSHVRRRPLGQMELRFIEFCRQAVPGMLNRLQGLAAPTHEKMEDACVSVLLESKALVGNAP